MTPISHLHLLYFLLQFSCCFITQTQSFTPSKSTSVLPLPTHHPLRTPFYTVKFNTHDEAKMSQHRSSLNTKLHLLPELSSSSSSIFLSSETESWRQYVPLAVSVAVIIDILLGSPLANLALGPMKRASEKGATGGNSEEGSDNGGEGGGSLFSSFGGKGRNVVDKSKERVDSEAIAQAALDKAMNTLELKRFLEENKTDEQRYEDVRKKIERQMDDLDNAM
mmetsp:Transcript_13214/g.22542  ORF Transcript_13214/g.22542 Transcript_13214/m.22542 type:complete len:222 (-) Transcript_13214:146-811(-)